MKWLDIFDEFSSAVIVERKFRRRWKGLDRMKGHFSGHHQPKITKRQAHFEMGRLISSNWLTKIHQFESKCQPGGSFVAWPNRSKARKGNGKNRQNLEIHSENRLFEYENSCQRQLECRPHCWLDVDQASQSITTFLFNYSHSTRAPPSGSDNGNNFLCFSHRDLNLNSASSDTAMHEGVGSDRNAFECFGEAIKLTLTMLASMWPSDCGDGIPFCGIGSSHRYGLWFCNLLIGFSTAIPSVANSQFAIPNGPNPTIWPTIHFINLRAQGECIVVAYASRFRWIRWNPSRPSAPPSNRPLIAQTLTKYLIN